MGLGKISGKIITIKSGLLVTNIDDVLWNETPLSRLLDFDSDVNWTDVNFN